MNIRIKKICLVGCCLALLGLIACQPEKMKLTPEPPQGSTELFRLAVQYLEVGRSFEAVHTFGDIFDLESTERQPDLVPCNSPDDIFCNARLGFSLAFMQNNVQFWDRLYDYLGHADQYPAASFDIIVDQLFYNGVLRPIANADTHLRRLQTDLLGQWQATGQFFQHLDLSLAAYDIDLEGRDIIHWAGQYQDAEFFAAYTSMHILNSLGKMISTARLGNALCLFRLIKGAIAKDPALADTTFFTMLHYMMGLILSKNLDAAPPPTIAAIVVPENCLDVPIEDNLKIKTPSTETGYLEDRSYVIPLQESLSQAVQALSYLFIALVYEDMNENAVVRDDRILRYEQNEIIIQARSKGDDPIRIFMPHSTNQDDLWDGILAILHDDFLPNHIPNAPSRHYANLYYGLNEGLEEDSHPETYSVWCLDSLNTLMHALFTNNAQMSETNQANASAKRWITIVQQILSQFFKQSSSSESALQFQECQPPATALAAQDSRDGISQCFFDVSRGFREMDVNFLRDIMDIAYESKIFLALETSLAGDDFTLTDDLKNSLLQLYSSYKQRPNSLIGRMITCLKI